MALQLRNHVPVVFAIPIQDDTSLEYSAAWDHAIEEYNNYVGVTNPKHKIDTSTSRLMYGFKASW